MNTDPAPSPKLW